MSCKRRANVMSEYVEESSSDEEQNDARDFDYVSSSGRSARGRQESIASNGSNGSETRRRGRGVSKRPCLNRNAQMARENRQKKKEYLENIENKLSFYRQENKNLSNVIQRQGIDLKRLKAEVSYLKNVLNNSSSITTLLKSMNETLSGKNGNRDIGINLRDRNDSGNSNSSGNHEEITQRSWKNNSRATWRQGGKYSDRSATRKQFEILAGDLKSKSLGDSDHTYTTSRDDCFDGKIGNYDEIDAICSKDSGSFSEIDRSIGDRLVDDFTTNSLNLGISGDIEELPNFDADLFESIGNDATANDSVDYFGHDRFNEDPGNLFESLDNSGICLHVNSGKISLEFCSICHLNSVNSTE